MAFDFSTLVTDRTQQDVAYVKQLVEKLVTGTATDAEKAEWNSFTLKGVYNYTDLNRVTAAIEYLKARLELYGYRVNYEKIALPREDRFSDVRLKPVSVESGTEYDSYVFEAPNVGNYLVTVMDDYGTATQAVRLESNEQDTTLDVSDSQLVNYTMLYDYGVENVDATGGWIANKRSGYYSAFSKNNDNLYIKGSGNGGYAEIRTANSVNLAGYSACFINANSVILAAGTTIEPSYMFVGGTVESEYYQNQNVIKFVIGNTAGQYNAPYFGSINGASAYLALQVRAIEQSEMTMFTVALLKHDDWQLLCSRAGISAPATVEELFNTKEPIMALLGSADTVNYIVKRCTGSFMGAAIASCVFPAFINMSPYKSVFYDNPHWNKFLTDNNMANRAYLYYYGNECDALTGGWETIPLAWEQAYNTPTAPVIERNATNMVITQVTTSQYYNAGMLKTTNKIPMASAKTVYFSVHASSQGAGEIIRLQVVKSIGTFVTTSVGPYKNILAYEHGPVEGVYSIDVSGIAEDCYIGISMYQESTVIVDRIWVE